VVVFVGLLLLALVVAVGDEDEVAAPISNASAASVANTIFIK